MSKEQKYRIWHSPLCMVVVLLGNGVSFLAGAGDLYVIAQSSIWIAIGLQWRVLIKGFKQDRISRTVREIEEFSKLLTDSISFKHYTFLHPVARRWYIRWYDKLRGITQLHFWTYSFDLDDKIHEFESTIKFPVSNKQLFEIKLKGFMDMSEAKDVVPALEYIGTELSTRVLAGPQEELTV